MSTATEDIGYSLTWGALRAVAVCFFVGWLILWAAGALIDLAGLRKFDGTDDAERKTRSGLRIYHDHGTGCQYLATAEGVLTPRLNETGAPICGK